MPEFYTMAQLDNTYTEHLEVKSYMVDHNLQLTPAFLFKLMQESAYIHTKLLGIGWHYLRSLNAFWALSKLDIEWLKCPKWCDNIHITTWGKQHRYLIQPRDFIVRNDAGETLVKATSHWVILDTKGKPQLISNFESRSQNQPGLHAIERQATRIRPVQDISHDLIYKPVVYTDIDMNGHVNNAAYVAWLMDDFGVEFHHRHELTFLAINYLMQTQPTDRYAIVQKEIAPDDYIATIVKEQDHTEVCRAETRWKPL